MGVHGERGASGSRGVSGERGPTGDHGQVGDVGPRGDIGQTGQTGRTGQRGSAYSSWLTRHVVAGYLLLCLGVLISTIATFYTFNYATEQNRETSVELCEENVKNRDAIRAFALNAAGGNGVTLSVPESAQDDPELAESLQDLINQTHPEPGGRSRFAERLDRDLPPMRCENGDPVFVTPTTSPGG
jgi:hypothetical protein